MPVQPIPIVAGLANLIPFVAPEALELQLGVKFQLRLGANESAFGPSPAALNAMHEAMSRVQFYGDPQSRKLREAIAAKHGLQIDNVAIGAGIDGLFVNFCRAFLDPSKSVITTLGSYPTFEYAVVGTGAPIVHVPYRDDKIDLESLAQAAREHGATMIYLANPDNPSGAFHDKDAVAEFLNQLPTDCILMLDEAYADFVESSQLPDSQDPRLVRFRTFSKAHGMAGMRVAYALGDVALISMLDRVRAHFEMNSIAQEAAIASLDSQDFVDQVVQECRQGLQAITEMAAKRGLKSLATNTNFILVDYGTRQKADEALSKFLKTGVFIRKPGKPPLDRCIRITTGTAEQMTLLDHLWPD